MPFGNLWGLMPYDNSDQLLSPGEQLSVQRQGNLGLAAGLLSAGGPSLHPTSFGQALGSSLMQGQALQNNAADSILKRQLVGQEIQKNKLAAAQYAQRPNIAALLNTLPGLNPQQAALIASIFQVDPKSAVDALNKIPGAIGPGEKDEVAKKISTLETTLGRKLTPDEALAVGGAKPEADSPDQKIATLTRALGRPPTREEALAVLGGGSALQSDKSAQPLPPSDLEKLRDPNGQKFPLGTTLAQAQAAGAVTTSQPEIDRKNAETIAKQSLDQLEQTALGKPGSGPYVPKTGGVLLGNPASVPLQALNNAGQNVGRWFGTAESEQRSKYEDARTALAQSLATAENPNDAVARESAVKRYLALIPDVNTSESEARDKFALLRSRLPSNSAPAATGGIKFLGFEQ